MKRLIIILFTALLAIGATGCGDGSSSTKNGVITTYLHFHDQNGNPLAVTLTYSSPSDKMYSVTSNASGDAVIVTTEAGFYIINRIDYPAESTTYIINNVSIRNDLSDLQENLVTRYDVTIDLSGNNPGFNVSFIRTQ